MFASTQENLSRQLKGIRLMVELLTEEFAYLRARDPQSVTRCEMSLQELIRQVAVERAQLKADLARAGLAGLEAYAVTLPLEQGQVIRKLASDIDAAEQASAKQAEKNYRLALGLYEQNKEMLDYIQKAVTPQNTGAYSAKGRYAQAHTAGNLISGRF